MENILNQIDKEKSELKQLIRHIGFLPSKWKKGDNSYYLLTISSKKEGYFQLTYFYNNKPVSDIIRDKPYHDDIIETLYNNQCQLEYLNYIQ